MEGDQQIGIGWRQPHYQALLTQRPPLAFLEVHSENFFGAGGAALAVLQQGREHYPISLHGVGLGLGSAMGIDESHLLRLAGLVERIEPLRVSDHASFARVPAAAGGAQASLHAGDLLPVAFTDASLRLMAANVQRVQERLKRPILVENLSAYLHWADDHLDEPEFFNALTRSTGCGLLLDVNNLVVNALNAAVPALYFACQYMDRLDLGSVGEIHLAGYSDQSGLVIDDHGSRVRPLVWQAYRHAIARFGALPSLIEWDTGVPALEVLLDEAAHARSHSAASVIQPSQAALAAPAEALA